MSHSVSSVASRAFASTNANDVVLSADGATLYAAGNDGVLRSYDVKSGALLASVAVGKRLGGMDISPDGTFLMVADLDPISASYSDSWPSNRFTIAAYKVDLSTSAVTTYSINTTGYEYSLNDIAILKDGTAYVTGNILPGWSGGVPSYLINLGTGVFTRAPGHFYTGTTVSASPDGAAMMIMENGISDAAIFMYTPGGQTVAHNGYKDGKSGYNYGVHAFSTVSKLAAQYFPGQTIWIYNQQLQLQTKLNWDQVEGLAFDETGKFLFVLDAETDKIVQLSTADWSVVHEIPVDGQVLATGGAYGNRLVVGPGMRFFTVTSVDTARTVEVIANPYGTDQIEGTAGNDVLAGSGFDDHLSGLGGDDWIAGGKGVDTLSGGAGTDTADYSQAAPNGVIVNMGIGVFATPPSGRNATRSVGPNEALDGWDNYETIEGFENIKTGAGHDVGIGSEAANRIETGAGNDTVLGQGGDDVIDGGAGTDTMYGGTGNDVFFVEDAGDKVYEYANQGDADEIRSAIHYSLASAPNVEWLTATGSAAIDLTGSAAANRITGNAAANSLAGLAGDDTLIGLGGADRLDGGAGADRMEGGTGGDIYLIDSGLDEMIEAAGEGFDSAYTSVGYALRAGSEIEVLATTDSGSTAALDLTGNEFNNNLIGNDGNNLLTGGLGDDYLSALGGGDVLNGGLGADFMAGGTGDDVYLVDNAGDVVLENAGEGFDAIYTSSSNSLRAGVEVELFGTIDYTATTALELGGNEFNNNIVGNNGNNALHGGAGDDYLSGLDGVDIFFGGAGADFMVGGTGDDIYHIDDPADVVLEKSGEGYDAIYTSSSIGLRDGVAVERIGTANYLSTDAIYITGNGFSQDVIGNEGNNQLSGMGGNDYLVGLDGHDILNGGSGSDIMEGGAGNDIYHVDDSGDIVREKAGEGYDSVYVTPFGGYSSTTLAEGAEIELLGTSNAEGTETVAFYGNAFANTIIGNNGQSLLQGGAGNDTLIGLGGDDVLAGGAGQDSLSGGSGKDVFQYFTGDSMAGAADIIVDFESGIDKINLFNSDANTNTPDMRDDFVQIGNAAFSGKAGELRWESVGAQTFVYGDTNGDGQADLAIIVNTPILLGSDFGF